MLSNRPQVEPGWMTGASTPDLGNYFESRKLGNINFYVQVIIIILRIWLWFNSLSESLSLEIKILDSQTLQKVIFRDVLLKGKTFLFSKYFLWNDSKTPQTEKSFTIFGISDWPWNITTPSSDSWVDCLTLAVTNVCRFGLFYPFHHELTPNVDPNGPVDEPIHYNIKGWIISVRILL